MRCVCDDLDIPMGIKPLIDENDYRQRRKDSVLLLYGPGFHSGMPSMVLSVEDHCGQVYPLVALICQPDAVRVRVFEQPVTADAFLGNKVLCWGQMFCGSAHGAIAHMAKKRIRYHYGNVSK